MRTRLSIALLAASIASVDCFPLFESRRRHTNVIGSRPFALTRCWAKGFGSSGGGYGSSKPFNKKPSKKALAKKIQKKYGGTTPQDIARGTQQQIEKAMKSLPPHLQIATQLYQQLQKWDARMESLSILQQANIPSQEAEGARRAQEELDRLYKERGFTENDLHNIFQKTTWDASADAKAARAITGEMPKDIAERVEKACSYVAEAVQAAGEGGRCLDVGCGFGVLVPYLKKNAVLPEQIYGVDLSDEMIRNAREQHVGVNFEAADFFQYTESPIVQDGFDGIIFCSSLHDLPDPMAALRKAASLLRPNGRLVIVHPQGASHVFYQFRSNPVLVKRGLPDVSELKELDLGLEFIVEPATPDSKEESREGYVAVLQR